MSSLFVSCNSIHDEFKDDTESTEISFSLSTDESILSRSTDTRSLTNDIYNYELELDVNSIQVLIYSISGNELLDVLEDLTVSELSRGKYFINGKVNRAKSDFKVAVLVNCEKVDYPSGNYYMYKPSDFNPFSDTKKSIPLWGELESNQVLQPGETTFIGAIRLERAMAKIDVVLSGKSYGYELLEVTMNYYNDRGYYIPNTTNIGSPHVPNNANSLANASFHKVDQQNFIIYLPEYKNEGTRELSIHIKFKDANGKILERNIPFGDYKQSVFQTPSHLVRNHHYLYNLVIQPTKSDSFNLDISTEESLLNQ